MQRKLETAGEALALIQQLLDSGKVKEAARLAESCGAGSPELRNAYGVALMRCGEVSRAIDVYMALCIGESGVCLKPNLPLSFRANYATALLLARNVAGCEALLRDVNGADDPYVQRLRTAIARWRRSLGWWRRLAHDWYGAQTPLPVPLDFEPGEIAAPRCAQPAA